MDGEIKEIHNDTETVSNEPIAKTETVTLSKEELNKMLQDGFKQMLSDYMLTVNKPVEPVKEEKKEETLEDYLF